MHKKEHVYLSHCPRASAKDGRGEQGLGKSPVMQDPSNSLGTCAALSSPPLLFSVLAAERQADAGDGCAQAGADPHVSHQHGVAVVSVRLAEQEVEGHDESSSSDPLPPSSAIEVGGGLLQQRYWVTSTLMADPVSHTRHLACPMGQLCKSLYRCCSKWPKPGIWICNLWVLPRHSLQPCVCPSSF